MNLAKLVVASLLLAVLTHNQPGLAVESADTGENPQLTALQLSTESQQQLLDFQQQLENLEIEFGAFDPRLMETLQGLSSVLITAGYYDEASRVIGRRLHLLRTLDGPANLAQLPIIHELIENDIRRADWHAVAKKFEYIVWLHHQNPDTAPEALMAAKNDLKDWYLTSLYLDDPALRVRNFQKARMIQRQNYQLAEDTYSDDSVDIIPWLYQKAIISYQIAVFLNSEDELGMEAREDIARFESRATASYLRDGLYAIKDIRDILRQQDDRQAEAMAMIYEADFQMTMSLGTARGLYLDAMDMLREAGITENKITEFFWRPAIIPVSEFYFTLDEALARQEENGYRIGDDASGNDTLNNDTGMEGPLDSVHLGNFVAWIESAPFAERPTIPDLARSIPIQHNEVELRFNISSTGHTRNPRSLSSNPNTTRVRTDARDALEKMYFRPRFVDGRWQRVKGATVRYLYPAKLD